MTGKKKIIFIVFIMILFVKITLLFAVTKGDVNSDGIIDAVDALMTAQYSVDLNPDPFDINAADVEACNGAINILDALLIAQYTVDLIDQFPCAQISPTPTILPTPNITSTPVPGKAIIVDHTSTNFTLIPLQAINQAKTTLHIDYGHTSHGSQLTTGMSGLVDFINNGGLGLSYPTDILKFNYGGTNDALDLREGDMAQDVGYYPTWVNETRNYLGIPDPVTGRGSNHPEINVIIWSWCGQASSQTEQSMLDNYLLPMTQLEQDYPKIIFVYMTGHADGSGETGNLHIRNQQIRNYCIVNNKVLYDFYDIECYDPDGNYYGNKYVTDNCDYDSNGDGSQDKNWAVDWQNSHTLGIDWFNCSTAHSQALNGNRKAYAAWWLWARLSGWNP